MIIHGNSRRVLFKDLKGDQYGLKGIPQDSVEGFLDIGANSGFVAILARFLHPEMKIVSVEPHPRVYADMVENVRNLEIKTMQLALGSGVPFYLYKERKMDLCNHFGPDTGPAGQSVKVDSASLDEIVRRSGVREESLGIKIDAEGAERHLLGHGPSEKIIQGSAFFTGEFHADGELEVKDYFSWVLDILQSTHIVTLERMARGLGIVRAIRKVYARDRVEQIRLPKT